MALYKKLYHFLLPSTPVLSNLCACSFIPNWKVLNYRKNSKIWDTSNNCHNCPKNRKVWCNIALMHPKDADGMANSVDPDQTASSEAVWSWSALFAETYLSQYIEFVQYAAQPLCWYSQNWLLWRGGCLEGVTHRHSIGSWPLSSSKATVLMMSVNVIILCYLHIYDEYIHYSYK